MAITNVIVWNAIKCMVRDSGLTDELVTTLSGVNIQELRKTKGQSPEIFAADLHNILCAANVSWDEFAAYFPKKLGIR